MAMLRKTTAPLSPSPFPVRQTASPRKRGERGLIQASDSRSTMANLRKRVQPLLNRIGLWSWRVLILFSVATLPPTSGVPDVKRLYGAIPALGCATIVTPMDRAGALEALQ